MSTFTEADHARLATLCAPTADLWGESPVMAYEPDIRYAGYKPEVREAPNGDTKACTEPGCGLYESCPACRGAGCVPNVDAGPAGKRYLHVAEKYLRAHPGLEWPREYLARAYYEACRVAEALGVPAAYYPRTADGTLRVLEYPSAAHRLGSTPGQCVCGEPWRAGMSTEVCPVLAAGAGTAEHTDPNLFTIVLWRSHPDDLQRMPLQGVGPYHPEHSKAERLSPGLHIGEIGELVGLGPATPHRVPARPYRQASIVYFAVPDHGAPLDCDCPRPDLHGHRPYLYRGGPQRPCRGTTVGQYLNEWKKRSRVYA